MQLEKNNRNRTSKINIAWISMLLMSLFEYIIDYNSFFIINKHIIFIFTTLICFIYLFIRRKIPISMERTSWLLFIIFVLIEMLLFNLDVSYFIHWFCLLLLLFIEINILQVHTIQKLLITIAIILSISCIIHYYVPEILYSIGRVFLNQTWEYEARTFASWNHYCGLTYQTGLTAIIIITGIASLICLNKKNIISYVVLIVLYVGLILTAKRMLFIISLICPFIAMYYNKNSIRSKKITRFLIIIFLFVFLVYIFYNFLPLFEEVTLFKRFTSNLLNYEEYLSGRITLFKKAWAIFTKHPIFGAGWGRFKDLSGEGMLVHNVYLQLLAETGIIGFVFFLVPALGILINTVKKINNCNHESKIKICLIYSLIIQIIFLLYSFSGNPLYDTSMRSVYIFACCISFSTNNKKYMKVGL